jgi:pimeloyl-ACP methyl ester carboxylesterase
MMLAGVAFELFEGGAGEPLLWLHGGGGFDARQDYVRLLARSRRLICPSHPGFGRSALPDWLDSIDDIAHLYLELLDTRAAGCIDVVGCSIGGWIAAEIATKVPERIRKLVMVGPVGVKVGPADRLDIPDVFALPPDKVQSLLYHDPERMRIDPARLSDDELAIMVRNRETLALLAWEPWMHNPKLPYRLHRVTAPSLFIRGESDGLVSQEYLDAYAKLLPNARTAVVARSGHAPFLEQPQEFVATVMRFLDA